jgi:hypothetical protein
MRQRFTKYNLRESSTIFFTQNAEKMKIPSLSMVFIVLVSTSLSGQFTLPNPFKKGESIDFSKVGVFQKNIDKAIQNFHQKSPVSTSFDDAIYEVEALSAYEPSEEAYRRLDIQAKSALGGYKLRSGLYTMNARSFCLRSGTYGPSRGDGHLYAPLKGKKSDFVQAVLKRYGENPHIPQQKIQVLLWAIVAGSDMNNLGTQHMNTLNELFSFEEMLEYKGKDWLKGIADKELNLFRQRLMKKVPDQIQRMIQSDNLIRDLVRQNHTYREIEKVAVWAGVAPAEDMIREVSKGRWSFHPDGFFVRFFPRGYQQTRIDVWVPFEGSIERDANGRITGVNENTGIVKEVLFNPSDMVATPANRSSQRIGLSSVPLNPCGENTSGDISLAWKEKARNMLLNFSDEEVINQPITCLYAKVYMQNSEKFKWAGLATLVSAKVGESQDDFHWGVGAWLKEDVFKGNRAVFEDLLWQHLAFQERGIGEMERLYCANAISQEVLDAWQKINEGDVWQGNLELLYHEQKEILQPLLYDNHKKMWWTVDSWMGIVAKMGNMLVSPVPGHSESFPGNNIANFQERWKWIAESIIPAWKAFETDPANGPSLMKAIREACPSCCDRN